MDAVILVIHLMVAAVMVGVVLLQRSEGGALGIGGGGGGGGFMSSRGAANVLTRTTTILAIAFFTTSITLTILARSGSAPTSILDEAAPATEQPARESGQDSVLPQLPKPSEPPSGPQAPISR